MCGKRNRSDILAAKGLAGVALAVNQRCHVAFAAKHVTVGIHPEFDYECKSHQKLKRGVLVAP